MSEPQGASVTRLAGRLRAMGATATIDEAGRATIHLPAGAPRRRISEAEAIGANSAGQLRSIIERVERLEEERKALGADIREVYAEAKANGFQANVLRRIVRLRAEDPAKRAEQEAILETYMAALGMVPGAREQNGR